MSRLLGVLLAIMITVAGCASYPDVNRQHMESQAQHYDNFDATLSWDVVRTGSGMTINGYFRNLRYLPMEDIEIWVAAIDGRGKSVAKQVSFVIPNMLRENDTAPFSVKLPVEPVPGQRLRFTYIYEMSEGGDSEGPGDIGRWMQSFEAVIPNLP